MTLLVAWTGVDTHGPASVYLASDSLISWGSETSFDFGRKVFSFKNHPDILGYCGDVLFPSIAINQIVEMADNGLLFKEFDSCKDKFNSIVNKLNQIFDKYPHMHEQITNDTLSIIHASRETRDNKRFFCHQITWNRDKGWSGEEVQYPSESNVLFAIGSGASEFNENYMRYQNSGNKNTSRNVFHCFCDTLINIKDPYCGGAPQIVGIYRKPDSPSKAFGDVLDGKRYFLGVQVDNLQNFNTIEWRNINFELCDGTTLKKFVQSQPQPDLLRRL